MIYELNLQIVRSWRVTASGDRLKRFVSKGAKSFGPNESRVETLDEGSSYNAILATRNENGRESTETETVRCVHRMFTEHIHRPFRMTN